MGGLRVSKVAKWFGVEGRFADRPPSRAAPIDVPLRGGQLILIAGASGSGKSTLLRRLRTTARAPRPGGRRAWVDLARVSLGRGDAPVVDVMADALGGGDDDASVVAALEALSRVGLGEVWTYLRPPRELSDGQRWRLRLALALARVGRRSGGGGGGGGVLVADEFGAPLDRVTARVVARAVRRAVSAGRDLCAVVATAHDDLEAALSPDVVVRCDFGAVTVSGAGEGPAR
jgi:ABC-type ATPase with predicted acetyltransferase domain